MKEHKSERNTEKSFNNNTLTVKELNSKNKSKLNQSQCHKSLGKFSDPSINNLEEELIMLTIWKESVLFQFILLGEQKDLLAERKKRGDIRAQKLAEDNQKFKSFWEK